MEPEEESSVHPCALAQLGWIQAMCHPDPISLPRLSSAGLESWEGRGEGRQIGVWGRSRKVDPKEDQPGEEGRARS